MENSDKEQVNTFSTLKDVIMILLSSDEMSISKIEKRINEKGIKIHRLVLTGYLQALRDLGYLREKEILPSKVYTVLNDKENTIYDIVGEVISGYPESGDLCIYILNKLFERPVMKWEVEKCKGSNIKYAEKVAFDERKILIDQLNSMGFNVQKNSPFYLPKKKYEDDFIDLLLKIIKKGFNLQKFTIQKQTQKKFDL
ncbi:MAG: hypothetical protein ACP5RZ_03165 [Thermoplasmata archaeon]